jgi:uncharacterized protein YkwD
MIPKHQTALRFPELCSRLPHQEKLWIGHKLHLLCARVTGVHLLASLAALALVGCGGGGSDKSSIPVENTDAFLVSSVPAPGYTGQALRAFEVLNAERARCGFGKLAQNRQIDTAADGHSVWMLRNGIQVHDQIPGTAGFTGTTVGDRLRVAGYPSARNWGEVISPIDDWTKTAEAGVRLLFNAPYHGLNLLRGFRDVGIGFRTSRDVDVPSDYLYGKLTIDLATSMVDAGQTAGNNVVRTYPCEGTSGVLHLLWGESPSPVPDRDLFANPIGTTVLVAGDINKKLTIVSAHMTGPGGVAVALRPAITDANDPNGAPGRAYLHSHEAFISADSPLATNTTYQLSITGTNGSMPFSRSFAFTTGGLLRGRPDFSSKNV